MAKMSTFVTSSEGNKLTKIALFIANAKESYLKAMDSYGNAIIKVKAK
ncbi:hypothetical protein [Bacillus sp. SA1-12]|nr:hypothetical protein [Bacillus sp. SA1-12]